MNEKVIDFLVKNGFTWMEKNSYANDMCNVVYEELKSDNKKIGYYAVSNNNGDTMYSSTLEIYWLIGVLTYYGYIDKNYKK